MTTEKNSALEMEKGELERCKCNKLLCVIKGQDIEIKCNKCKRMMVVKTKGITEVEID